MKNVLVTGGAGFIGANFIFYWLEAHPGDRVVCVDKLTYAGNLSTLAVVIAAVAVFVMGLELLGDLYFHGAWGPSWSLVVLIVAVGLEIPLMVVRRVPGLRREARRRFHM